MITQRSGKNDSTMPSVKKSARLSASKRQAPGTASRSTKRKASKSTRNSASNAPLASSSPAKADEVWGEQLSHIAAKVHTIYKECLQQKQSSKVCRSAVLQELATYLDELNKEAVLMVDMQHKALHGHSLTEKEARIYRALQLKQRTLQQETSHLQAAQLQLKQARDQQTAMQQLCLTPVVPARERTKLLQQTEQMVTEALARTKQTLSTLLSHDWALKTFLAVTFAALTGWGAHRAFVNTAAATTALLHEANQMTQTITAVTEMIQVSSHEGAKWTLSGLGGAVGAANGLLLSSFLPGGSIAKLAATALSGAAIGAYTGFTAVAL